MHELECRLATSGNFIANVILIIEIIITLNAMEQPKDPLSYSNFWHKKRKNSARFWNFAKFRSWSTLFRLRTEEDS